MQDSHTLYVSSNCLDSWGSRKKHLLLCLLSHNIYKASVYNNSSEWYCLGLDEKLDEKVDEKLDEKVDEKLL